jgi:hypothetical protein
MVLRIFLLIEDGTRTQEGVNAPNIDIYTGKQLNKDGLQKATLDLKEVSMPIEGEPIEGEELSHEIDPERLKALQEFKKREPETFRAAEDQNEAARIDNENGRKYFKERTKMTAEGSARDGRKWVLKPGALVYRNNQYQEIKSPLEVELQSANYDFVTTKMLPDGSVMHLKDMSALEPVEAKEKTQE